MKITSQKDVKVNQRCRTSKYRWLYDEIDTKLIEGETLVIENLDSIREAQLIISAIRRQYDNIKIHLRKYSENGLHSPTIYLNWR